MARYNSRNTGASPEWRRRHVRRKRRRGKRIGMQRGGRTGGTRNCGQNQNPAQCNGLPSCEWCSNMGRRGTCVTAGHCGIQQTGLDYYWEDPGVMGGMVNCIQNPNHPSCRGADSQYQRGGQVGMGRSTRRKVVATAHQCLNPDGVWTGACLAGCTGPPCGQPKPPGSVRGGGGGYDPYPNHPAAQNAAMPGTGKTGYNFDLFIDIADCIRAFGSQSEGGLNAPMLGMCRDAVVISQ